MTEINDKRELKNIHWVGFGVSLISAPLLISAVLLGPLFVLDTFYNDADIHGAMAVLSILIAIGATLYFAIGTPVMIYHLKHHAPQMGRIVSIALLSVLAMLPVGALFSLVTFDMMPLFFAAISTFFGIIGAPVLAIIFTAVYMRFVRT